MALRDRKYAKGDRQDLNDRELADLLSAITDPRDKAIFALAARLGLRASEVGKLRLAQLNLDTGELYVHRLKGSVSAEHLLPPRVLRLIKAYLRVRGKQPGPLFLSREGLPISRSTLDRLMKRYGRAAGLPASKCHFHALKHTAGMLALQHGDLADVQALLGHKDPKSTQVYADVHNSRRRAFEQRLAEIW